MGGFAGHMSHLYDNPGLTFKQMKDVFTKASNGELVGTEKTDGQNLYISYSVKTGQAKAVRNKGEILTGGMNAEQLALKFADHPNPNIKEVFTDAFDAFESAVQSLDPELQLKIFGSDANVFYNSEIQDPRTRNVIAYDKKLLNIHQVGHVILDKENRKIKTKGFKTYYRALDKALDSMQDALQDREYNVQKNAIRHLNALSEDIALKDALARLENELNKAGVSDNQTIADYLVARLVPYIESQVELPEENKKVLLQRFFKIKGVTFNHAVKGLEKDVKEEVRALLKNEKNIMKSMIYPVEDIVHDFSVAMLKGFESSFVLGGDDAKEVIRLRGEVSKARTAIENSGSEEAIRILNQEMRKLKNIENVSTAAEGFVFDYDGVTYKFTGNFAPMNQILGLFKYGRGNIPPLQALDEQGANTGVLDTEMCEAVYITIPGAFKPPHRGHYQMVEHYATLFPNGTVTVLVSPLAASERKGYDAATQADVGVKESLAIWQLYAGHLSNVTVIVSDMRSPVQATYEFVGDEGPLQSGDCVMPGASTKGGDEKRWSSFAKGAQKYAKEGVEILDPIQNAFTPSENLSATDLRVAMKSGDIDGMKAFLPDHIKSRADEILNILGISSEPSLTLEGTKKKGEDISSIIYRVIEEALDEQTEPIQRAWRAKHEKNKLTTKGKKKKSPPFTVNPPKNRGKSAPPMGENEELEEVSSMAGGNVQGAAMGRGREKPTSPFEDLDVEKENEDEKKRSHTIKGKKLTTEEDELVENILDYLLSKNLGA